MIQDNNSVYGFGGVVATVAIRRHQTTVKIWWALVSAIAADFERRKEHRVEQKKDGRRKLKRILLAVHNRGQPAGCVVAVAP